MEKFDIEKFNEFNKQFNLGELRLSVTRKWGNRTISTKSSAWKTIKKKILVRDNYTCFYCGLRSEKYMVCDHIDGNAENNELSNFRILCPLCDLIRHCGIAAIFNKLYLYISKMSQVDIVKKTVEYYVKTRNIPKPEEIDPEAVLVKETTIDFANVLLKKNYDELSPEENQYKGFFTSNALIHLQQILG